MKKYMTNSSYKQKKSTEAKYAMSYIAPKALTRETHEFVYNNSYPLHFFTYYIITI